MADTDYIINLVADVKGSLKSVEQLSSSVDKQISQIRSSFTSVAAVAGAALASIGAAFSLKAAIDEASEFEKDVNQLRISLTATGQATDKTIESFKDYAQSLQETTTASDNVVLQTASVIQNIAQLGEKDLKVATKAALDLSAAMGIDATSAAALLAKAAEGNVTALKRYGIEVRQGKSDTESFANTIKVIEDRFGGASEKATNTFSGAMSQLRNAASDAIKTFGLLITQSPEVIEAIRIITDGFVKLTKSIADNEGIVRRSITAFADFIKSVDGRAEVYAEIEKSIKTNTSSTRDLSDQIDQNIQAAKQFRVARIEAEKTAEITAKNIRDQLETNTIEGLKKVSDELKNSGQSQAQIVKETQDNQIKVIRDAQSLGLLSQREANSLRTKAQAKFEDDMAKIQEESNKKRKEREQEIENSRRNTSAIVAGFLNNVSAGANGVASAFQAVAGMIIDKVLPGLGGAAAALVGFLSQGPEAVRAQIQAFIDNIPLIIDAIVASIPVVIEVLAANAPHIALSLASQMPFVATKLAISLVAQSPQIAKGFIDGLIAESGRLITAIADGVKQAISQITNIAGGGGGTLGAIVNPLGAISKKLKFAEGGIVPGGAPYTDRIPAMLTPGEVVIPRDQVASLGGAGNIIVKLVLGEQELASTIVDLRARGFGV